MREIDDYAEGLFRIAEAIKESSTPRAIETAFGFSFESSHYDANGDARDTNVTDGLFAIARSIDRLTSAIATLAEKQ